NEALPLMAEAEQHAGAHAEWDLIRARYWSRRARPESRAELAKLEQRLGKYQGHEQDALRDGLAAAYAALEDGESADRLWRQVAERQPQNLAVRFVLLERAVEAGKEGEVERLLVEVRRLEGGAGAV